MAAPEPDGVQRLRRRDETGADRPFRQAPGLRSQLKREGGATPDDGERTAGRTALLRLVSGARLYFEDLKIGQSWSTGGRTLTEAEITAFAQAYDPQALHLDTEWAREGPFGGLIASGFQTLNLAWALWVRVGVFAESSRGGIGIDTLRWTAPVRPGDTIRGAAVVRECSETPRRGRGRVVIEHTFRNQRGEMVLTFRTLSLVASREGLDRQAPPP